jgi:hypothetical protein
MLFWQHKLDFILFEGPSGSGLIARAKFVSQCCISSSPSDKSLKLHEIPCVLLGPESTVENIIGTFKPQNIY